MVKITWLCRLKKKRCTAWELWVSFIWGKMKTVAQEAAPQIALRDCSKAAVGASQYTRFWWRESSIPWSTHFTKGFCYSWGSDVTVKGFSASLDLRRYKDWDLFRKTSNYLKTCPSRSPGVQSSSLEPELPQGLLKVNSYSSMGFNLCKGRWQMPLLFSHWQMLLAMLLVTASL